MFEGMKKVQESTILGAIKWYAPSGSKTVRRAEVGKFHLWLEKKRIKKKRFIFSEEYDRYVFQVLNDGGDTVFNTEDIDARGSIDEAHVLWLLVEKYNGQTVDAKEFLAELNRL